MTAPGSKEALGEALAKLRGALNHTECRLFKGAVLTPSERVRLLDAFGHFLRCAEALGAPELSGRLERGGGEGVHAGEEP